MESLTNKVGGTHVVWLSAHVESTESSPGGIPGSIRFTLLEPNFVEKDSIHHKGPPPGEGGLLLKECGRRHTAVL